MEKDVDNDLCILFGKRLAFVRKEKGFSQASLAATANLDRTQLNRIEKGFQNVTLYTIQKLSMALNVPVAELFVFEED